MEQQGRRVRFLASVTTASEARLVAALGADIIDAKDPAAGSLGALGIDAVREIRASLPAAVAVSATIGDPVPDPALMARRVEHMAATGVDIVKVGLDAQAAPQATLDHLGRTALRSVRLVAVLLADRGLDLELIPRAKDAGFSGVMLDTADKGNGALPDIVAPRVLQAFIAAAHNAGLFAGFAGSLRVNHVAGLAAYDPDVLGYRGGLCRDCERIGAIDVSAVRAVRRAIDEANAAKSCGRAPTDGIARRQPERAL
jgi:(5-formylfuran-3-yl)methyl phosphate synthase